MSTSQQNSSSPAPKTIYDIWGQGNSMPNIAGNVPPSTGAPFSGVNISVQPSDPNPMQNFLNTPAAWSPLNRKGQ